MRIGFRAQIYPTVEQIKTLKYYAMCSHKMWNHVVAKWKNVENDKLPLFNKLGVENYGPRDLLNEFEKETGYGEIPERIALDVLQRYGTTWVNCFKKVKPDSSPPTFHKYDSKRQSFCVCSRTYKIDVNGATQMPVYGPGGSAKKYRLPINQKFLSKHPLLTSITDPTFSCRYGKWYVSGSYEVPSPQQKENTEWLGLDWGVDTFFTTSKGKELVYPDSVIRQFYRVNALKSKRDKKEKGSNNRKKLDAKLDKANQRLAGLKRNFIEQTTTKLCREFNIAIEDLTYAKITRSTSNRRRLRHIAPRYLFTRRLEQKCQKYGTKFAAVSRAYTSKTCSNCNYVNYAFDREKTFICPKCNLNLHRDINAAMNIAARGVCYSHKSKGATRMDSSSSA